jgi:glutamine synthetase
MLPSLFSASAASASSAKPRNALTESLKITIPQRPQLETVLKSIVAREERITFSSLLLTTNDVQRIKDAFSSVPPNSNMTIVVFQMFTNPQSESMDDIFLFWDAIKHKVKLVIWEQNKFHQRFLRHLKEDAGQDSTITAELEFVLCDKTGSPHASESSRSPASLLPHSVFSKVLRNDNLHTGQGCPPVEDTVGDGLTPHL